MERKSRCGGREADAGAENQFLKRKIRCGGREADARAENQFSRAENRLLEQRNRRWSVDYWSGEADARKKN
jgi:hypothetical protein